MLGVHRGGLQTLAQIRLLGLWTVPLFVEGGRERQPVFDRITFTAGQKDWWVWFSVGFADPKRFDRHPALPSVSWQCWQLVGFSTDFVCIGPVAFGGAVLATFAFLACWLCLVVCLTATQVAAIVRSASRVGPGP